MNYKYKMTIAYEGTQYSGWQIQPGTMTIQEILQQKLAILLKHTPDVIGAGRTDTGVHALNQVAHFCHSEPLDLYRFLLSINALLPRDIRVMKIEPISMDFHARYSAFNKIYHYHINLGPVQDPFQRLYSWHIPQKFDVSLLKECAQLFLGTHDFTSFAHESKVGAASRNPVRTIKRLEIVKEPYGIRIEFEAKGFLYKMVRNLTGILVEVAKGKRDLHEIPKILSAKDRRKAGQTAPPKGLFLVRVDYPSEFASTDSKDEK